VLLKSILYKIASSTLWKNEAKPLNLTNITCIWAKVDPKIALEGSLLKPKKDPPLETRRGKCNRALREPKRVPMDTKIRAQAYLARAQTVLRNAHPRLKLAHPITQAKTAAARVQRRKWKMSWEHSHSKLPVIPPECLLFSIISIMWAAPHLLRLGSGPAQLRLRFA
jgi:hypothetical protein